MDKPTPLKAPTLKTLDDLRKEGYRPGVVSCIINDKRVLMLYRRDYNLWMLPQGGINNKELPKDALSRNLIDELGAEFVADLDFSKIDFIDTDRMEFKPGRHDLAELKDDSGKEVQLIGKEYFFCIVNAASTKIDLTKTPFDEYFWMSFREAYFIADRIYQRGKRRITLKVLNGLQSLGYIE